MFMRTSLLTTALFLAGCVTSPTGPTFSALPQSPVAADQIRLYVFRNKVLYLAQAPYTARAPVVIDGRVAGHVVNGGFLRLDIPAGEHLIAVTANADQTVRYFKAPGGSEVYIQVYDKTRMEGVAPALAGVPGSVAHAIAQSEAAAAANEGRVWGVNFVARENALPILYQLSLSE